MKKALLVISCILVLTSALAQKQTKSDSLKHLLLSAKTDTARIVLILKLSDAYTERKPDSEIYYAKQALVLNRANNDKYTSAAFGAITHAEYNKGNYAEALKFGLQAIKILEKQKSLTQLANAYNNLGNIYKGQENYIKAVYYYKTCEQTAFSCGDKRDLAFAYLNLGYVYGQMNKLDSSVYYASKAINFSEKNHLMYGIDYDLSNLGTVNFKQKHYQAAYNYYHQALKIARNGANIRNEGMFCLLLAQYFYQVHSVDSALFYASLGLHNANKTLSRKTSYQSAELLSMIYEANHQTDSAFKYLKLSGSIKDSIYNAAKFQEISNLTTDEFLRHEEVAATELKYQNRQQKILLIFVAAGLLAAAVFSFVLVVNNRQKLRANQLLKKQQDELKATQQQLIQSEKMASLGELTAGIAHEIQNPLNFVNNFSDVNREMIDELKEELKGGNIDEAIAIADDIQQNEEKINHHGKRADFIVKGMLQHSRTSTGERQLTNINVLADEFFKLSYHGLRAKDKNFNAELVTNFDENLPKINIVQQDIGRVLLNLFNNAFYAVNQKMKTVAMHSFGAGAEYKPTVTVITSFGAGQLVIKVKDNGIGMPDSIKEKIMQPFFTTKPTGEGTGLGLSLTYDMVVKGHAGSIKVDSVEGEGAEFIISLPLKVEL